MMLCHFKMITVLIRNTRKGCINYKSKVVSYYDFFFNVFEKVSYANQGCIYLK